MKRKKCTTWGPTFTAEEAGSLWHASSVVLWYLSTRNTPLEAADPSRLIGDPEVSVPAEANSMFRLTGAPDLSTPAKAKSSRRCTGAPEASTEVRSPWRSIGFLVTSFTADSGSPCGLIGAPASIPEEANSRCKLIAGPSDSTPAVVGGEAGGLLVAGARRKSSGQRSPGTVVRSSSMGSSSSMGPCRI